MFWYSGQLIQGNALELAIDEPGLIYGATVFTTLRVWEQSLDSPLTNWQGHCDRLQQSLQAFGWQQPDWQQLRRGAAAMMPYFPVLRLVVFANGREWITGRPLPVDIQDRQQQGIAAWVADSPQFRRSLAVHKTGNYLSAWLALQQAQQLGAKEAILVDEAGNWLETSTGNLWGYSQGKWLTPPVDGKILPGIARSHLLEKLQQQQEIVVEVPWHQSLVESLEAIAYTNSVLQIVPIRAIYCGNSTYRYPASAARFQPCQAFFSSP